MTACPEKDPMLQALLDGELDAANAIAIEQHLKTCAGCAAQYAALQAVRDRLAEAELASPAPEHLRSRIVAMLDNEDRRSAPAPRRPWWAGVAAAWSATGAMAAVAAALFVFELAPTANLLEAQLMDAHLRSLQPGHLIDVATSDRHVVRPWFNGRIDYAPPVPDLVAKGFPLVGGRLDYADGRPVAALVYRHGAHVINLFVLRDRGASLPRPSHAPPGYAVLHWRDGGLDYWAISDVEDGQIRAFKTAFEAAS